MIKGINKELIMALIVIRISSVSVLPLDIKQEERPLPGKAFDHDILPQNWTVVVLGM